MTGTRQTNTFGEALLKFQKDWGALKVLPDADIPFIIDIETKLIQKIRQPEEQASASGQSNLPMGPPSDSMGGGMPGGMGGMGMGGPPGPPGPPMPPPGSPMGPPAGIPQHPSINGDEVRRMLANQ